VVERDGVLTWHSCHDLPFLVNAAVRLDASIDAASAIREADDRFAGDYEMVTVVGVDDDVYEAMRSTGSDDADPDPLQALDDPATIGTPVLPASIELRTVLDAAGLADLVAVNQDASGVYGFPSDLFATILQNPATVLADDVEAVVAYEGDRPLATAQVFFDGPTAYVGWVATTRAAMRRGLGTLVTHDVVARGARRGATAAVLMASPMGAPVYRRMGFVDVGWLRGIVRRRATPS
jgi:hypothetical protein